MMAKNEFAAVDSPSPHPTPLDAFGASILRLSESATRRLGSPLLCSSKILKLYYSASFYIFALRMLPLSAGGTYGTDFL